MLPGVGNSESCPLQVEGRLADELYEPDSVKSVRSSRALNSRALRTIPEMKTNTHFYARLKEMEV